MAGQDALRHVFPRRAAHGRAPSQCNLAVSDLPRSCFAAVKQEEQDNLDDFITWDSFLLLLCSWQCTNYELIGKC